MIWKRASTRRQGNREEGMEKKQQPVPPGCVIDPSNLEHGAKVFLDGRERLPRAGSLPVLVGRLFVSESDCVHIS